jgi:hypothetical protein
MFTESARQWKQIIFESEEPGPKFLPTGTNPLVGYTAGVRTVVSQRMLNPAHVGSYSPHTYQLGCGVVSNVYMLQRADL